VVPIPDDFELQPLATIPIKKPEAREQARLVAALRCKWSKIDNLERRPVVFHIPNGGSRNAMEASNLKTQGVLAGVPDLCIVMPGGEIIWVEMKAEDGRVSPFQKSLHENFSALGHDPIVAYSAEEALAKLRHRVN
jgi:hypothetical protein